MMYGEGTITIIVMSTAMGILTLMRLFFFLSRDKKKKWGAALTLHEKMGGQNYAITLLPS